MSDKFWYCKICGNVVVYAAEHTDALVCCGEDMTLLEAGTVDAAKEKHVPEVKREGNTLEIKIGSEPHPMLAAHYIEFVAVIQEGLTQIQTLKPEEEPKARFNVNDGPARVYEFCNLHGLWMIEA